MARTSLDIVSLQRAKRELEIPDVASDHDALLEDQIAAAVSWISEQVSAPLVQRRDSFRLDCPPRADEPAILRAGYVQRILRARYWSDGAALRGAPDGEITDTDLGEFVRLSDGVSEIWPPSDDWPERERGSPLVIETVRQVHPTPGGLVAACVVALRQLYDGVQDIRPSATMRALWAPYATYNRDAHTFGTDISMDEVYVDLSPSAAATAAYYFGWSADRSIATADFAGADRENGPTGTLSAIAANSYPWFAVPSTVGFPAQLRVGTSLRNQLAAFEQFVSTVDDSNGVAHIIGMGRRLWTAQASTRTVRLIY